MTTLTYYQPTAARLNEEEAAELADEAFAIERQVKAAMRKGREALWELAEALYDFDEARGWRNLGYEHLTDWLADTEIGIPRATYYRCVRTWRKLVVERQVDAARLRLLDQSKVAEVVDKIAAAEVTVDEALDDVEAMGWRDLRERYRAQKSPSAGTREPETGALDDTPEPARTDVLDEVRAYEAQMDAESEDEALSGEVLDPVAPTGTVSRYLAAEITAALPAPVLALLHGPRLQVARDEIHGAIESGAAHPRVSRGMLLAIEELLEGLGA
jgi:hypothetical protein